MKPRKTDTTPIYVIEMGLWLLHDVVPEIRRPVHVETDDGTKYAVSATRSGHVVVKPASPSTRRRACVRSP